MKIGDMKIVLEFEVVEVQRPLLSAELLLTGGAKIQLQRSASTLRLPFRTAGPTIALQKRRGIFGFDARVVDMQGVDTQSEGEWPLRGVSAGIPGERPVRP